MITRTMFGNMIKHTNTGDVLIFGLSYDNNQIGEFKKAHRKYDINCQH